MSTLSRVFLIAVVTLSSLAGCRSEPLPPDTDADTTLRDGGVVPADLGLQAFCDGKSPRIEVNGNLATSPFVRAEEQFLDCCTSAAFEVTSMQIPGETVPVVLAWRRFVGAGGGSRETVDLANLPTSWSVSVTTSCPLDAPDCFPKDQYDAGMAGTLTVQARPNAGGYRMSVCASLTEDAASPHPLLHSMRLWVPEMPTRN